MAQTSDTGMTPAPEGDGTGLPPAVPVETLREGPTKQSGSIGPAGRAALTTRFDLLGLERLDYTLTTRPWRTGILVEGTLSADVVQTCVVTLDPVTTRIDEEFVRGLLPRDELYANVRPGIELELEIDPELDDIPEELTDPVGLGEILAESLALALPAYPRAEGVEPVTTTAAPKNVTPLGDADVKPFAALEALKARFNGGDEG